MGLAYSSVLVLACGCWHWQYSMPIARVMVAPIVRCYGLTTANILDRRPDYPGCCRAMSGRGTICARHFRRSTSSLISGWRLWKARCTRSPVARARLIRPAEIRAIDAVLADGAGRARNLARQTMDAVKDVVGFVAVLIGAPRVPQPNLRRSPALELASKFAT